MRLADAVARTEAPGGRAGLWSLEANAGYARGLVRATMGALVFALPVFMTMEMWAIGATVEPWRLLVLAGCSLPALVMLSWFAGFQPTFSLLENVLDAFAAIAVSVVASAAVMALFSVITPDQSPSDVTGKLCLMALAGAIGALLADKQFGDRQGDDSPSASRSRGGGTTYVSRLFVMGVGAVFLALNIAPTDEVHLLAAMMAPWQTALLACLSVACLHVFLFGLDTDMILAGRGGRLGSRVVRYALAGYGVAVGLSAFILWVFGRLDGAGLDEMVERVAILGFPASLGAGGAHLIIGGDDAD